MVVLTIIGALVLIAGCGFFMLRHNVLEENRNFALAGMAKLVASSCFVLLGILFALWCRDRYWRFLTPIALLFGLGGDVLLSMSQRKKTPLFFLLGVIAFALEHYIQLMFMVSFKGATFIFGVIFTVLLGMAILYLSKKYRVSVGKLGVGAMCYFIVLLMMAGIAFGTMCLSFTFGSFLFAIGALLFVGSDTLLLLHNFGALREQRFGNLVMLTYYAAQILFAFSLLGR